MFLAPSPRHYPLPLALPPRPFPLAPYLSPAYRFRSQAPSNQGPIYRHDVVVCPSSQRMSCESREPCFGTRSSHSPDGAVRVERLSERAGMLRRQHELCAPGKPGRRELGPTKSQLPRAVSFQAFSHRPPGSCGFIDLPILVDLRVLRGSSRSFVDLRVLRGSSCFSCIFVLRC